jgi:hypothetical protein
MSSRSLCGLSVASLLLLYGRVWLLAENSFTSPPLVLALPCVAVL